MIEYYCKHPINNYKIELYLNENELLLGYVYVNINQYYFKKKITIF